MIDLYLKNEAALASCRKRCLAVSGQIRWQELDGDVAIQPGVMRQVDDAHAPAPELGDDRIRAEGRAGGEGHGRRG